MIDATAPLATGVPGLDLILGGGLSRYAQVVLVGAPGAGKTILGSQLVFAAVARGEPALVLTMFSEGHVKLLAHLRSFTFFDESQIGGAVTVLALEPLLSDDPDAAATALVRTIRESGVRLVLIDGVQGLMDLLGDIRAVRRFLARLAALSSYLDVTLLLTVAGSSRDVALAPVLTTADVVIGLDYQIDGLRHVRHLEVIKQRGQAPLGGLHPYTITTAGLAVVARLEARPLPSTAAATNRPGGLWAARTGWSARRWADAREHHRAGRCTGGGQDAARPGVGAGGGRRGAPHRGAEFWRACGGP